MNGGLQNLGNTCGINTLVQCIASCERLNECILSCNTSPNTKLVHELKDVLRLSSVEKVSVNPQGLVTAIYDVFKGMLRQYEQHDICELWMLFSDKIAEELGVAYPRPSRRVDAIIHKQNEGKTSNWLKHIQGLSLSIIKCQDCEHMLCNCETFTMISLDIPNEGHVRLGDLIIKYISVEPLTDYKCDKCQSTHCFKQIQLERLPRIMVIVLKRFRMTSTLQFEKIHTPVDLIDKLSIDGTEYMLKGVGNHFGSYNGGHYTSLTKMSNGRWCHHDDISKESCTGADFFRKNSNAYVMFYEQSG